MAKSARPVTDRYRTLAAPATAEPPKIKGSRHIGEAAPIATADQALAVVEAARRREHSAVHHCWAYRLAPADPAPRSSDDGEPNGSAGVPIAREIEGRDLWGVVVVVTRYYGGTKLGVGGLVRAYGEAAGAALDAARKRAVIVRVPVRLAFAFADTSPAMRLLDQFDATVAEQTYTPEGSVLSLAVRAGEAEALQAAFVEATAGRGTVLD